jgi:nucleotide-binding universal stress UspA family protein
LFKRILVGIDGSNGSKKALATAIAIAKRFGADFHGIFEKKHLGHYALIVGEVVEENEQIEISALLVTEEALDMAGQEEAELRCEVRSGHQVKSIVDFVRERNVDLLVIGSSSHGRIFGRICGDTSQILAKSAPCSVLVVK